MVIIKQQSLKTYQELYFYCDIENYLKCPFISRLYINVIFVLFSTFNHLLTQMYTLFKWTNVMGPLVMLL